MTWLAEYVWLMVVFPPWCLFGLQIARCCKCKICADDFNRSDDTDIDADRACGWTEDSGTWEISGNTLIVTKM